MPNIQESNIIKGVYTVHLRPFPDERGRFVETFRKEWFPFCTWDSVQNNRSDSKQNVLRGLHYHKKQVDYWYVSHGKLRAVLADLRPDSPTYLKTQIIDIDTNDHFGLFIPVGVAHGFVALTDCILNYVVNNYYDSTDEYGVKWDDPDLAIEWGIENPIISERDQENGFLADIDKDELPHLEN